MNWIRLAWAHWRRNAARDELLQMQARSDVGPIYLCGLIAHINELEWRIASLTN